MDDLFLLFLFVFVAIWGGFVGYISHSSEVQDSCVLEGELIVGDYEFNCSLKGE